MRHIRNAALNLIELGFDLVEGRLNIGDLLAQGAPLFFSLLAFFRGLALPDRLRDGVRLLVQRFDFLLFFAPERLQLDKAIHVGDDVSVFAVFFYRVDVFQNELAIKHCS